MINAAAKVSSSAGRLDRQLGISQAASTFSGEVVYLFPRLSCSSLYFKDIPVSCCFQRVFPDVVNPLFDTICGKMYCTVTVKTKVGVR